MEARNREIARFINKSETPPRNWISTKKWFLHQSATFAKRRETFQSVTFLLEKAARNYNICLHFLPTYSPNLNPIERVWKVMNEKVRNNVFFNSAKEFRKKITDFFDYTWEDIAPQLTSRINDNFETILSAV